MFPLRCFRLGRCRLAEGLICLWIGALSACGVEPWADKRLPVTNGLALWIDVSRQNAARGALNQAPLRSWNDSPDYLHDGSGHRRDLSQPYLAARPRFRQEFNGAMLSFDGTNDFLAWLQPGWQAQEATVFVVANPHRIQSFAGPIAASERGRNDYLTGFNLDFGGQADGQLRRVNVEGAGFSGEQDLLGGAPQPLGRWHLWSVNLGRGSAGVKLFMDGTPRGSRARNAGTVLRLDELTLGARRYSNNAERSHAQGFFGGDLAEVLLYDRLLGDDERAAVERYLSDKYGALLRGLGGAPVREGAVPLVSVTNPPPVQVHFPGFTAQALPVELGNVNNVRYRADGKLVAVGYDGRVWLLSDTDADGLEDKVEPFWDRQTIRSPIGAALTPPGYARGEGVFIAAKDRLVLVVDTDRDGRADEDVTVATWTERSEQQGVDALGVAVGPDGSLYFSLGAASFTEPFLIDKTSGQARYRTTQERGTIQRVAPDFSRRETVATGIRFAVGLAFNREGDLFATDQEGATWRHDGNPLDELLHIQAGRHYGFPPRHPKHLPGVVDEPSTYDYMPQHQSTCGLQFNFLPNSSAGEAAAAGGRGVWFGPDTWRDDALVAGYSRGKVWRTSLVKSAAGYVAQTHLIATLQSLVVDVCVSPRGDLIVASHSGQPDWGTGPTGKGLLWRIRYERRGAPQPVAAWNESPTELVVAFDRPLETAAVRALADKALVESGAFVFPGDRFETIRPGYQVVYDQLAAPRHRHEILGSRLTADRRSLTLLTKPRVMAVNYAVTLPEAIGDDGGTANPGPANPPAERARAGGFPEVDLLAALNGMEASWESADGRETWAGWLPHLDLQVARAFTAGSAEHERLIGLLARPGRLTLRGQLDLWQMLQPAIQPGAAIDWERPAETVTVRFEGPIGLKAQFGGASARSTGSGAGLMRIEQKFDAPGRRWQSFELQLPTGPSGVRLVPTWATADDSERWRPFALRRFYVPWAQPADFAPGSGGTREVPEIAGGNWLHGRRLYFSERLGCAKCHAIRGEGAPVGPELSNLVHRDYASVRKDIQFPNAALNPDHIASLIELSDGESVTGIIQREQDGQLQVVAGSGAVAVLPRARVSAVKPAALSLMPEGLWEGLSGVEQRDLMTFLLTVPLEPAEVAPEIQGQSRPPARKRSEIAFLFPQASHHHAEGVENAIAAAAPAALRIVLCAAPKDPGHGAPGFHDYPLWRERWSKLLALADGVSVETAERWPSPEQWQRANIVAFYHDNPAWVADKVADLDAFLARGGGVIFLHWSMNAYRDLEPLKERLGRAWGPGAKFRYGAEELVFAPHVLTAGLPTAVKFVDEAYWNLPGSDAGATVLATSVEEGKPTPQVWLKEMGRGRVFVCIPGHFTWTFDDPFYRVLLLRGFAWAGGQPLERFHELVPIGARVGD